VDGGVLADLGTFEGFGFQGFGVGRKTSAVHVSKVTPSLPAMWIAGGCRLRLAKNGGTSSNVVISRF